MNSIIGYEHFVFISFEIMKELIYNHPLFPLLMIIFEKCELATHHLPISDDCLASFSEDVHAFIQQFYQNSSYRSITTDHREIDQLMIDAIRVLHLHLLELEKVNELSENFCEKYVQILKEQISSHFAIDEMKFDEENFFDQDDNSISDEMIENENYSEVENVHCHRKKRGIFPKAATSLMRTWLFDHLHHPYPTDDEKRRLAEETQLSVIQVNNWFINARRRIVQPMIDQSNRMAMFTHDPSSGLSPYSFYDHSM